jgi:peptide/nickel transport system permease protein
MARYIIRRLIQAVAVVFVISIVTFGIFQIMPAISHASPAYLYVGKIADPHAIKAIESHLGLDKPVVTQYWVWLKGIFVGRTYSDGNTVDKCPAPCLGYSYRFNTPVTDLIISRFPVTLSLTVGAAVLWLLIGVPIGIVSALRRGSFLDRSLMAFALAGVSLPTFFLGYVLLLVFSYGPKALRWFPNPQWVPFSENPAQWAHNMVLPWLTIAITSAALYARLTRANVLEVNSEDYIRTAVAKGLPKRSVNRHSMRSALTPLITIFGIDVAGLLAGAIITEQVFNLPGLGKLSVDAIATQDLPVIMGVTILGAIFIVIANIIVDIAYGVADPRVRFK